MKWTWDQTRWGNFSQIISAGAAVLALGALIAAYGNYRAQLAETRNKLSADAMFEWSNRQPENTRPCIELISKFEPDDWKKIINRQQMLLAPLKDLVLACLSDQDPKDLSKAFEQTSGRLTPYGAFVLANRANKMLEADSFIAGFLLKEIGNHDMLKPIGVAICRDDAPIINKLPNIKGLNESFVSLRRYIDAPRPNGCRQI